MEYFIYSYGFSDTESYQYKYFKENPENRKIANNKFISLVSKEQLKLKKRDLNHMPSIYSFNCAYHNRIEEFEKYLKTLNVPSWKEEQDYLKLNRIDSLSQELHHFINSEKVKIEFKKHSKNKIIYLLKDNNEVVYVGQSKNLTRPWEHEDKIWDSVEIINIPQNINLHLIEQLYIDKYKPKYNKARPIASEIMQGVYEKIKEYET